MLLRRFLQSFKEQNWFVVGLDVLVVIVGIFLGLKVTDWSEERNDRVEERVILTRLNHDLSLDMKQMNFELGNKEKWMNDYIYCLNVLAGRVDATKEEFMEKFRTILLIGYIDQTKTTFNDLQTSGQFSLIQRRDISEAIVDYYHTDVSGWVSADREYTRNILAPYLLEFDYSPQGYTEGFSDELEAIRTNVSDYALPEKSLDEYKRNYFIINALRAKIYTLEGQIIQMNNLLDEAEALSKKIEDYINSEL